MPRCCSISDHPHRDEIERAIAEGAEELEICEEFGISKLVVRRHKEHARPAVRRKPADPAPRAAVPKLAPAPAVQGRSGDATEAVERVQALVERGEPNGRLYDVASRELSRLLDVGLNPDQKRAWDTFLRTLRQASDAEGTALDRHPDFPGLVEDVVAAVVTVLGADAPEGIEGQIADCLEELQAARPELSGQKRRAAA